MPPKYGKKKPMGGSKKKGGGTVDNPTMSPVYSGRGSGADIGSVKTMDRKDCLKPGDNRQGQQPKKGPVFE